MESPDTMDKTSTEAGGKPKSSRRQLNNKLSRSIEAHRLRLLKARGAKSATYGRLCECRECDVTSMKPSMMCLKAKGVSRGSNITHIDSVKPLHMQQSVVEESVLNIEMPAKPIGLNHVNKARLHELKQSGNKIASIDHQQSFDEYCEAFDIKNNAGKSGVLSSDEGRKSELEGWNDNSATYRSNIDGPMSSRSKSPYDMSCSAKDSQSIAVTDEEAAQIKSLVRRFASIRIVDSQGEDRRVDIEDKILSLVNKIVNEKVTNVDIARSRVKNDCAMKTECMEKADILINNQKSTETKGFEDIPQPESASMQQMENAKCNTQISTNNANQNEDVDRYRSVVDVLLEYISSGRSERSKVQLETSAQEEKSTVRGDSLGVSSRRSQVPSETQMMTEESDERSGDSMLCDSRKGSFLWCNKVERDITPISQRTSVSNVDCVNSAPCKHVGNRGSVQTNKDGPWTIPSRMTSSVVRNAQPMSAFVKTPSSMGSYAAYVQPTVQQFVGPYRIQPPCTPTPFSYNQRVCPTMNCCQTQNMRMSYAGAVMPHQMSPHVVTPVLRRRHTPDSQRSMKLQHPCGLNPSHLYVPRMYTGMMPHNLTVQHHVGVSTVQSPMRSMPRHATGPLYRRNTGRAHMRQVQATMM